MSGRLLSASNIPINWWRSPRLILAWDLSCIHPVAALQISALRQHDCYVRPYRRNFFVFSLWLCIMYNSTMKVIILSSLRNSILWCEIHCITFWGHSNSSYAQLCVYPIFPWKRINLGIVVPGNIGGWPSEETGNGRREKGRINITKYKR